MDLNQQWSEYHSLSLEIAKKAQEAEEKSKIIKEYKKNDYIIICTSKTRFIQKELGSCDIKPFGGVFEIELLDDTTHVRYMYKKIEYHEATKQEAVKQANEVFNFFKSLAF